MILSLYQIQSTLEIYTLSVESPYILFTSLLGRLYVMLYQTNVLAVLSCIILIVLARILTESSFINHLLVRLISYYQIMNVFLNYVYHVYKLLLMRLKMIYFYLIKANLLIFCYRQLFI